MGDFNLVHRNVFSSGNRETVLFIDPDLPECYYSAHADKAFWQLEIVEHCATKLTGQKTPSHYAIRAIQDYYNALYNHDPPVLLSKYLRSLGKHVQPAQAPEVWDRLLEDPSVFFVAAML